ncbi:olfactory receptor 52L1-like [Pholidichthys leucotaenia]
MENSTRFSYFRLTAYYDTGTLKYVVFIFVLSLYLLIMCANVFLILAICMNRSLHEPMYMFLCSLFVNELYGSTGLFPFLLVHILSDVHTVSSFFCFLQIFFVHFYGSVEYFTLGAMSYDRYLAICHPLYYNMRMTPCKVVAITAFVCLYSVLATVVMMSLSVPLQLCGNIIDKVYCDNYSIVKLACGDTTVNNIYGLVYIFTVIVCLVILIFYSYLRILKVCFSGSKLTRQKAVRTCTPHLASLLNFSFGAFFEITQSRFDMSHVPHVLRIFLSLYFLSCPPLINPVLYGLNMPKVRNTFRSLAFGRKM